jgi:hypothetical protein
MTRRSQRSVGVVLRAARLALLRTMRPTEVMM